MADGNPPTGDFGERFVKALVGLGFKNDGAVVISRIMAQLPQEFLDDHPQLSVHERHTPRFSTSPKARRDWRKIKRQRAALAHVDATIRLFSPGSNPDAILPKRAYRRTRYFARNELFRLTHDALRTASEPLTSAEIAAAVMQAKGMPTDDAALKEIVAERALTALRRLTKRGTVVKPGISRNVQWALAPSLL